MSHVQCDSAPTPHQDCNVQFVVMGRGVLPRLDTLSVAAYQAMPGRRCFPWLTTPLEP